MASLRRNGLRIVSLGAATALVTAPLAAAPSEAALRKAARFTGTVRHGGFLELRKAKPTEPRGTERNKQIARALMRRYGWTSRRQFRCLELLWGRESGWSEHAHNSSSGAHGIPQALPGGKMASAGPDWRSNPRTQIKWGLRYVAARHGTPCGAWAHFQATGWY
ncbi:aggregation-promoting factor C-terminal-like domain-containing protein [Actinomadura macrotermitis]|uniref:Transglycosylase SLT domain-containing protein n=1 Tax=Actinomadura macrotermitis TaxID=2585200 RepID=A0A7K0BSA7_9ACTN|nr:hypothetical protein [Actinomadura macrotermitis]